MVEFIHDTENQRCVCRTDKLTTDVTIEKELGGFRFFIIKFAAGPVPKELGGRYSSIQSAQAGVEKYLRNKRQSVSARRKEFGDNYEKRKKARDASKSKSKSSK
jgi:hypothetical protein